MSFGQLAGLLGDLVRHMHRIRPVETDFGRSVLELDRAHERGQGAGHVVKQAGWGSRLGGAFRFEDVAAAIADKMVDRHPHVFGDLKIADADTQTVSWEARKAAERAKKGGEQPTGALDGVARALPALLRAEKIQKRAARVGFDWKTIGPVIDKIEEELGELRTEIEAGKTDPARVTDELGDVLFAVANLARHCKVNPEAALRSTNDKFEKRFRYVEQHLAVRGKKPAEATLEEMEALWQEAKTKA